MNKADIDKFLRNDPIIVFDTNMWLDIYRVLPDEIANILTLLNKPEIKNKLFIPVFVNLEFLKHYQQLVSEHERIVDKVNGSLKATIIEFSNKILANVEELSNRHKLSSKGTIRKLKRQLSNLESTANEFLQYNDTQTVLDSSHIVGRVKLFFEECYEANYMNCLEADNILELFIEGEQRFAHKIPPGFMDKIKEEKGKFIYGDLIIWKEIILYAYNNSKNVIFVTNDVKKDWFENNEFHSKLVTEFERETNKKIMGLKGSDFYSYAKGKFLSSGETLSDIDTYIEARAKEFIDNISSELYDKVNNELYYTFGDKNAIYDPWVVLSEYDGTYYEYEDILNFDFIDVTCERETNDVILQACFKIEFTVQTAGYEGRDDETRDVIQSPPRHHELAGTVNFLIRKSADEFLFDLYGYDSIDIEDGAICEMKYDDGFCDDK